MNEKIRPVLVIAFALLAAFFTYRLLAGARETATVVVAAVDIAPGTAIDAAMLSQVTVGKREQETLVPTAIRQFDQVIGRAPKRLIKKGSVLTLDPDELPLAEDALKEATGGQVPPAYLIPKGMVAVAIPVDAHSSVGYTLQKGDRVNLIFTWKKGEEAFSETVLTEVEVFDVGKGEGGLSGGGARALTTVTLLVSPDDAEKIVLAKRTGIVDLALTGK